MDIYREEILEHWQSPQNFRQMDDADIVVEEVNPLCGDEITMYFRVKRDKGTKGQSKKVDKVTFVSSGCAISTASASILTEAIKGKSIKEISTLEGKEVLKMLGADKSFPPARLKCAFLALEALRQAQGKLLRNIG